jgi:CRISPR-associated endoribonuclease Cas6
MRFKLIFEGEKTDFKNEDLRRNFISFLKKTFQKSSEEKYNSLFASKKLKPYVYSPFLGDEFKDNLIGPQISFIFSSGDNEIISIFWNGILQLKKEKKDNLILCNKKFFLKDIKLLPEKNINSKKVLFKTIGISLMTDPDSSPSNFKNWFVIPEKENLEKFNEILKKRVKQKFRMIKNIDIEPEIRFSLYEKDGKILINETVVPLFGGFARGFRGYFYLEGNTKILKFLYDYGFGVRTGQGFGLLEVVKQI